MGSLEESPIPEDDLSRLQSDIVSGIVNNPRNSLINPYTGGGVHRDRWQGPIEYRRRRRVDEPFGEFSVCEVTATYNAGEIDVIDKFTLAHHNTRLVKSDNAQNNKVEYTATKRIPKRGYQDQILNETTDLKVPEEVFGLLEEKGFPLSYTPEDTNGGEEIALLHDSKNYRLRMANTRVMEYKHRLYNHIVIDLGDEKIAVFHDEPKGLFRTLVSCGFPRDYSPFTTSETMSLYEQAQRDKQDRQEREKLAEEQERAIKEAVENIDKSFAALLNDS